jgi:hypothetical protein
MDKQYTITEIANIYGVNRHTLQMASKRVFGDRIKAYRISYFEENEIQLILNELKSKVEHYQKIKSIEGDIAIINIDGYDVLIDKSDIDKVMNINWVICKRPKYVIHYYHIKNRKTKSLSLHRYLTNANKSDMIDHINRNTFDNRKSNLRLCNKSENACNAGKSLANKSGYKGVSWDKKKENWRAYIVKNNKQYYLGNFTNIENAYGAYCKAAEELHGEFARLA